MRILKYIINLLFRLKIAISLIKKTKLILQNIIKKPIPKDFLAQNKKYWGKLDILHSSKWAKIYHSINDIDDYKYISEQTYYSEVEPRLNNASFSEAYSDKSFYSILFPGKYLPKIFLRCIDGVLYDESNQQIDYNEIKELIANQSKLVIKKSVETGGGKGVDIYTKNEEKFNLLLNSKNAIELLINKFGRNFIIQEYINQHSFFKTFNESSVNTVRILTYRSVISNEIFVINSVLRIGKKGAIVDNQASGGISCGVNIETGEINEFAIDKYGIKFKEFNGVLFNKQIIPFFDKMKFIAIEVAEKYKYHRLLGFDFTIDSENNIKLIEVNNKNNEINFYQMNNGPLFGKFSDEILEHCLRAPKTINIDFNI